MSQIDSELNILREKLVLLEEQKKLEEQMKIEQEAKKIFNEINPILISLTKYTSEDLLKLKAKKDDDNRIIKITEFIKNIHKYVIQYAETNLDTKYKYQIPNIQNNNNYNYPTDEFYIKNKLEIICNLQHLFPGCDIKYVTLEKILIPHDNKLYDKDNLTNFKNFTQNQLIEYTKKIDYIIIDWS